MKKAPPLRRIFQQFLTLRPITWLMARILHHADALLLRLSNGKLTFAQFSGLPIIELTTTGAKSRKRRTLPLTGLPDGEKYALIASNFGQAHFPGWYYNLKANPECTVKKDGQTGVYLAREADEQENEHYYALAISYYVGYAAYKQRAKSRKIPVMVLEPKKSSANLR
ncbi:MAG: nitroreductase family deazaflavin-dependent oxidoreductase [Anaerolineales bacterium]|nr:nitroreductase family deazaflavin-dependent oxidoreductase [Anaerolineales bacterium]